MAGDIFVRVFSNETTIHWNIYIRRLMWLYFIIMISSGLAHEYGPGYQDHQSTISLTDIYWTCRVVTLQVFETIGHRAVAVITRTTNQASYLLSGWTPFQKISWRLEAAKFGFSLFQSPWPVAGTSAAARLRDCTRFAGKTSYRSVIRGPGVLSFNQITAAWYGCPICKWVTETW